MLAEAGVIGDMVRHNLAAIRYRNYDFFLGVYSNDQLTVQAAAQLAAGLRNVHVAECPHPGPTSKADCLNWVYQRMLLFEESHGVRFETVVVHDAEDLIHPDALALINEQRSRFDMVQVPVLPLPTPCGRVDARHLLRGFRRVPIYRHASPPDQRLIHSVERRGNRIFS